MQLDISESERDFRDRNNRNMASPRTRRVLQELRPTDENTVTIIFNAILLQHTNCKHDLK